MISFNYILLKDKEAFSSAAIAANEDGSLYFTLLNISAKISLSFAPHSIDFDYDALIIVEGDANNSPLLITHGKVIEITGGNNYESLLSALNSKADASVVEQILNLLENFEVQGNKIWLVTDVNNLPEDILNGDIVVKNSDYSKQLILSADGPALEGSYWFDDEREVENNAGVLCAGSGIENNAIEDYLTASYNNITIESPYELADFFKIDIYDNSFPIDGSVNYDSERQLYVLTASVQDILSVINNKETYMQEYFDEYGASILPCFTTNITSEEYYDDDSSFEAFATQLLESYLVFNVYAVSTSSTQIYCYNDQLKKILTEDDSDSFLTESSADNKYLQASSLTDYATKTYVNTSIANGDVNTSLSLRSNLSVDGAVIKAGSFNTYSRFVTISKPTGSEDLVLNIQYQGNITDIFDFSKDVLLFALFTNDIPIKPSYYINIKHNGSQIKRLPFKYHCSFTPRFDPSNSNGYLPIVITLSEVLVAFSKFIDETNTQLGNINRHIDETTAVYIDEDHEGTILDYYQENSYKTIHPNLKQGDIIIFDGLMYLVEYFGGNDEDAPEDPGDEPEEPLNPEENLLDYFTNGTDEEPEEPNSEDYDDEDEYQEAYDTWLEDHATWESEYEDYQYAIEEYESAYSDWETEHKEWEEKYNLFVNFEYKEWPVFIQIGLPNININSLLNSNQVSAINSGITTDKVSKYEGYLNTISKLNAYTKKTLTLSCLRNKKYRVDHDDGDTIPYLSNINSATPSGSYHALVSEPFTLDYDAIPSIDASCKRTGWDYYFVVTDKDNYTSITNICNADDPRIQGADSVINSIYYNGNNWDTNDDEDNSVDYTFINYDFIRGCEARIIAVNQSYKDVTLSDSQSLNVFKVTVESANDFFEAYDLVYLHDIRAHKNKYCNISGNNAFPTFTSLSDGNVTSWQIDNDVLVGNIEINETDNDRIFDFRNLKDSNDEPIPVDFSVVINGLTDRETTIYFKGIDSHSIIPANNVAITDLCFCGEEPDYDEDKEYVLSILGNTIVYGELTRGVAPALEEEE